MQSAITAGLLLVLITLCEMSSALQKCPEHCKCSEYLTDIDCSGKQLSRVPTDIPTNVTRLNLNNNGINHITVSAFAGLSLLTWLSIQKNSISSIEIGAFIDQQNLIDLYLKTNRKLTSEALDKEVFRGLKKLEHLHLGVNSLTRIPDAYHIPNLRRITMDVNQISELNFPEGYARVSSLDSITLGSNKLQSLQRGGFGSLNLTAVVYLGLSTNGINSISPNVFDGFSSLRRLVLSYNLIPQESLMNVVQSLHSTSLEWLDFDGVIKYQLPFGLLQNLTSLPLKTLTISHANKWLIEDGTFNGIYGLEFLDLSSSDMVDISGGAFGDVGVKRLHMKKTKLEKIPLGLPPGLVQLDLSENPNLLNVSSHIFSQMSNLTTLSLSRCSIDYMDDDAFVGMFNLISMDLSSNAIPASLFKALISLQNLKLGKNRIGEIAAQPDMLQLFNNLSSLTRLDLHDNKLGNFLASDTEGHLFRNLQMLEELFLNNNDIKHLPKRIFHELRSLKRLYLHNNLLSSWGPGIFEGLSKAEMINFGNNSISIINETSMDGLSEGVRFNLENNNFACWCELRGFRHWMDTASVNLVNKETYVCSFPARYADQPLLSFRPEDIGWECLKEFIYEVVVIILTVLIGTILLSLSLRYRYRWPFRLWVYNRRRRFRAWWRFTPGYNEVENTRYEFSILYSQADRQWVLYTLVPQIDPEGLEGKLFFEDKEVDPNKWQLDAVLEGIYESRRSIVVVSQEFSECPQCCDYVLPAVISNGIMRGLPLKGIILILLNKVEAPPLVLIPICMKDRKLVWPLDGGAGAADGRRLFWTKLADQMGEVSVTPVRAQVRETVPYTP